MCSNDIMVKSSNNIYQLQTELYKDIYFINGKDGQDIIVTSL